MKIKKTKRFAASSILALALSVPSLAVQAQPPVAATYPRRLEASVSERVVIEALTDRHFTVATREQSSVVADLVRGRNSLRVRASFSTSNVSLSIVSTSGFNARQSAREIDRLRTAIVDAAEDAAEQAAVTELAIGGSQANYGIHQLASAPNRPIRPLSVPVVSGGGIDVGPLHQGCTGFVTSQPDVILRVSGVSSTLRFAATADRDTTLVVRAPDGRMHCADDVDGLNPRLDIATVAGQYDVWVGSYERNENVDSTFSVTQTGVVPALVVPTTPPATSPQQLELTGNQAGAASLRIQGLRLSSTPQSIRVRPGGQIPAGQIRTSGQACVGYVSSRPDVIVDYSRPGTQLNFAVAGNGSDTTLVVQAPNGAFFCNDDTNGNDPLVALSGPTAGIYRVWAGNFSQGLAPNSGTLTINDGSTTVVQQAPVQQAPVQQAPVQQVRPEPNCSVLLASSGQGHLISQCQGADPYCAEALIRAGSPHFLSSCRGVVRECAVAVVESGAPHMLSSCRNVEPRCAVAAARAGVPHMISSCQNVEPDCAVAIIQAGTPHLLSQCRRR